MLHKLSLTIRALLSRLKFLREALRVPDTGLLKVLKAFVDQLLNTPYVSELLRVVFLGGVMEASRVMSNKIADWAQHFFVVKASFAKGDFAYDWVARYLEDQKIWSQSRVFQVGILDPRYDNNDPSREPDPEGRPQPLYQPAKESPEFFRWRNRWIMVNMAEGRGKDASGSLTLSVWSRNRQILDDFVQEAREHYFNSAVPPKQLHYLPDSSGSLITARFNSGDVSFDWMVEWVQNNLRLGGVIDFEITTKPADLAVISDRDPHSRSFMAYKPYSVAKQVIKWHGHWLQFDVNSQRDYRDPHILSGSIYVSAYTTNRAVITELIEAARDEYMKIFTSKVTVHLADQYGSWARTIRKSRRSLNTLMLPDGTKEMLLNDIREFLDSEKWYTWAGVPHRRGYLLYGEPGTGKSTTIHALASELNLEIYYIQLAAQGMNDHSLQRLISETPARCIMLLEDIDCALQNRENDDDDLQVDMYGNQVNKHYERVSDVTLSGLLNALDSVTSEEGRIIFSTTNHIEKLDPALIREGRMDVKVEYKLASRDQIHQTFLRFYLECGTGGTAPSGDIPAFWHTDSEHISTDQIKALADEFADQIPELKYSLAQLQGFMLTKKNNPRGAVNGIKKWIEQQEVEKRMLEEKKAKRRKQREEKEMEEKERQKAAAQAQAVPVVVPVMSRRVDSAPGTPLINGKVLRRVEVNGFNLDDDEADHSYESAPASPPAVVTEVAPMVEGY